MDIDKAYIMGQSFSNNKHYIKWSPLFRYNSDLSLQASKTLPLPRGYQLTLIDDVNYSIDQEITEILNEPLLHNQIKYKANLIRKIDSQKGFYYISTDSEEIQQLLQEIQQHEDYKINKNLQAGAFKNVASANIYNVVHAIRNRDQAYSPITMKDLQKEADKSPKGQYVKQLNMFNPLTKYIMQYQNLVGKNVIGIAANGEKVWFNLTYFYNDILRNRKDVSSILRLKKYKRIHNRSKGNPVEFVSKTIPDIGQINQQLRNRLYEIFQQTDFEDKYVDQLISQLLSAATDNAKELILAKINSGTQTAKYYIHLIILGFSLDDIVAFMTSPVVELIDKYSTNNYFLKQENSINDAVELLKGKVKLDNWLIPPKKSYEEIMEEIIYQLEGGKSDPYAYIFNVLKFNKKSKSLFYSAEEFVKYYILVKTNQLQTSEDFEIQQKIEFIKNYNVSETGVYDVDRLFDFINQLIFDIVNHKDYDPINFDEDIKQFEQLTEEANETTQLASTWLGLNQGLPQTDQDIIEKLHKMQQSVYTREKQFFGKTKSFNKEIIKKIQENNPMLNEDYITEILKNSVDIELYNNFDIKKYLSNENNYRQYASDYYNLIKSNWNILDIVNTIPHYSAILDLFNYTITTRNLFSTKSNILDNLMEQVKHIKLSKKQYKQAVRYVDNMHVLSFTISQLSFVQTHKPVTVYDGKYNKVKSDKIYLTSLAGIDSFRDFVETDFVDYLHENYGHLQLVKDLIDYSYFGKNSIITRLNLNDVENSLLNGQTFNQYLLDINTLSKENYDENFKVTDILQLYSLLMNGTRLGGKYLTALFTQQIVNGSLLMKYYDYIQKQDYNKHLNVLNDLINKEDFLLYIAPTVGSRYSLKNRKELFVKVANDKTGYDVYEKYENGYGYKNIKIEGMTDSQLYRYRINSIVPYHKLYEKLYQNNSWNIFNKYRDLQDLKMLLQDNIKKGLLTIYEECDGV